MIQFRIVKYFDEYAIEYKTWFGWSKVVTEFGTATFSSIEEAEEQIKDWKRYEKENGEIVKEIDE